MLLPASIEGCDEHSLASRAQDGFFCLPAAIELTQIEPKLWCEQLVARNNELNTGLNEALALK